MARNDVQASVGFDGLPVSLVRLLQQSELLKQGAEAKLYRAELYSSGSIQGSFTVAIKHRFKKAYRHPTLDAQLTKQRVASEGRALLRCLRAGIDVPQVRFMDVKNGLIALEWINGWTIKQVLDSIAQRRQRTPQSNERSSTDDVPDVDAVGLLKAIGRVIAMMHLADTIHGDLTTSNMMLRRGSTNDDLQLVMIDLGLASGVAGHEERAVDLYVLERALASTHASMDIDVAETSTLRGSSTIFVAILQGYEEVTSTKGRPGDWDKLKDRLEEVRARGRKRSMVG